MDVSTRRRAGEVARKSGGASTSGNLWASTTSGSTGAVGFELVAMAAVPYGLSTYAAPRRSQRSPAKWERCLVTCRRRRREELMLESERGEIRVVDGERGEAAAAAELDLDTGFCVTDR